MNDVVATVRRPVWTGSQAVAGLWLPAWVPLAERERRLLRAWRTGSRAWRFAQGDLIRWPAPERIDCARLSGQALCLLADGRLAGAPLVADELALAAADVDVLLVEGAHVAGLRLADARALDLSAAIDLGGVALHEPFDCTRSVARPRADELAGKDVRTLVGDKVPPPSEERGKLIAALQEQAAAEEKRRGGLGGSGSGSGGFGGVPGGGLMRGLGRMFGWLAGAAGAAGGAGGAQPPGRVPPRRAPAGPQPWRDRLARLAVLSRLSSLIGWRQGAYLRKVMKMFDDGDLMEALRHALPLDGDPSRDLGQAFGAPGRRDSLELSGALGGVANIGLPVEFQQHLRQLYRNAFERLDRAGRIDEALFVLAELLNARQEALDYLEKHGRAAQAAELALRWEMPPATCVRLLLLAGDWKRAIQVARRDGDFAAVVAALSAKNSEHVPKLRLAWGEALADRGDYLGAVEAVWPVPEARNAAMHWLRLAEEGGARLSARALVQRAVLLPDTLRTYRDRILALAEDEGDAAMAARAACADALLAVKGKSDALRALAAALLPALVADRAANANALSRSQLNRIEDLAADALARADLPPAQHPAAAAATPLWQRDVPLEPEAPAAGLQPILDAVALPDDEYLVALGEAGVVVIDTAGRVRQRFAVPAHALVAGEGGRVALAVALREGVARVARLDLVARSVIELGALPLSAFAPHFDGIAWSVVSEDRLLVLDTARSLQHVLWSVGDLPGRRVASRFNVAAELHLIASPWGHEVWNYEARTRRLVSRTAVVVDKDADAQLLVGPGGLCTLKHEVSPGRLSVHGGSPHAAARLDIHLPGDATPVGIEYRAVEPFSVLTSVDTVVGAVHVLTWDALRREVLRLAWPAGVPLGMRAQHDRLLFFDGQGRLLDVSTTTATTRTITLA